MARVSRVETSSSPSGEYSTRHVWLRRVEYCVQLQSTTSLFVALYGQIYGCVITSSLPLLERLNCVSV
jgi:hypothetical protein